MAEPTINFPGNGHIAANGAYYFRVTPNTLHLLSMKGDFDGGTVSLYVYNPARDEIELVNGASWTADLEARFVSLFPIAAIVLGGSGGSPDLWAAYGPISSSLKTR